RDKSDRDQFDKPLRTHLLSQILTACDKLRHSFGGAVAQLGARLDGIEEVVGSNPIGSTSLSFCFQSDSKNFKGHSGALSHLRRQYEADDFAVRLALTFVHGLAVNVHRGSDIGVAH